jgi:hypothetical protein
MNVRRCISELLGNRQRRLRDLETLSMIWDANSRGLFIGAGHGAHQRLEEDQNGNRYIRAGHLVHRRDGRVYYLCNPKAIRLCAMLDFGKFFVFLGLTLLLLGGLLLLLGRTNLPLGRLPGDILYRGKNTTFYFPLATSILISVVLSLVLYAAGKLRK